MTSPLETYHLFQQYLRTGDWAHLAEVADFDRYTENCVGLTGWTTGLQTAIANFQKNIASGLSDMHLSEEDAVEGTDAVSVRLRAEATHTGTFLGIPATGRRIEYDAVDIVRIENLKIVWRYLLCDWHSVEKQLRG
jgi:predicted ester cyclase